MKLLRLFGALAGAILTISIAAAATSVLDTIDLSPSADVYLPQRMALNHTTHKLYIAGAYAAGFQNHGVKVIDTNSGAVTGGIDLGRYVVGTDRPRVEVNLIALDESATVGGNRVFTAGFSGVSNQSLRTVMRIIDGQNDTLLNGEGSDLFLPIGSPEAIAVNSSTHKVYVLDANGNVAVVDGPTGSVTSHFDAGVGASPHVLVANPATNKIFVFGRSGAAIIDGAGGGASPMAVPPSFNAVVGAYNSANGRIYVFGSDSSGNSGLFVFDGSSGASLLSKTSGISVDVRGLTIDPAANTLYAATPTSFSAAGPIAAFDAGDLSSTGSFNVGAAALEFDSVNGGRLFLLDYDFSAVFPALRNSVGILNPTSGVLTKTTLGYTPNELAINAQTSRIYVADEQAAELVVLSAADHSVLARVPVNPATSDPHYPYQSAIRHVAVSETLNRVYLTRTSSALDGTKTAFVDVFDGSNNQLLQSVSLSANFLAPVGFVAVDDTHHRVFVTGTTFNGSTYDAMVFVLNADTNAVLTSFATTNSVGGIGVNPVTGRIYVGNNNGGGHVQIFDGASFTLITTVNAGAVPGPMSINKTTNTIYVADTGAGSVDNRVTVINGATNTVATLSNTNTNNGDAVTAVAVDESTNTIYVGDNSNQTEINGRVTIFSGANNAFLSQVDVGRYPASLAFDSTTHELFVSNNEDGTISVLGSGVPPPPPVPAHGGLSATVFRVNGSKSPTNNLADTALHFAAQQSGTPGGLVVRVQVNTTPNNNAVDWIDLNNGSNGYMTLDKATQQFVLSSTNYPTANGLYFRAFSTAPGYPASASNVVGPFNLPEGQAHLGSTTLLVATNGPGAEMKFRANVAVDQATITLFIQATTMPDDDASWIGLVDGRSGQMHPFADPKKFYLDTTKYPPGAPVYFRAVATAVGFTQSISNVLGVTDVIVGTPPTVEVIPPPPQSGSQSGLDPDHPIIAAMGTFNLGATVSSPEGKTIKKLGLIYDGSTIDTRGNGASNMTTQYTTNVSGDHVIKAFAVDERGIVGYAAPVYIRIKPVGGKVFHMVASGDWSGPGNWQDESNNPGIPGANDFAIVGALNASIAQNVTAFSVSLNGGSISGAGGVFTVSKLLSIAAGQLPNINLVINQGAKMVLVGDTNVPMSGLVTNHGSIDVTGRGGIVPVPAAARSGKSPIETDGFFDGIAAFFKNAGDFIFHRPSTPAPQTPPPSTPPLVPAPHGVLASKFENSGRLITNDGASLISQDGGGVVSHDGGSLITQDGASLITNDGGSVISNDGGSLIGNDGASLITNDGGSRPARSSATDAAPAAVANPGYVQTSGETDLSHIQMVSSVTLNGGTLSGSGVIVGSLTNNSGFISPGHSAGVIAITGDFNQGVDGTLIVENGGGGFGKADQLQIDGAANLGGNLHVRTIGGYTPDPLDTFNPLGYGSVSGSFSSVTGNTQVTMNPTGILGAIDPTKPNPKFGQPLNISTRMRVLTGDNVLIGGFIVTGPSGSTKKVMIRGLGPSLASAGLSGLLTDPLLELHLASGATIINDNWADLPNKSEIPNGFAPQAKESVIIADLVPGNYTVIERGAHGEIGLGLTEIYDMNDTATAQLGNISTRGFVGTGDNVLIGGFIVGGSEPGVILVRAIGPSIGAGLNGLLADPILELHDVNGNVYLNDNWRDAQESEIAATTIPPGDNHEPAILATLVPGNYTVIVQGKNQTSGIALVEAYNVK